MLDIKRLKKKLAGHRLNDEDVAVQLGMRPDTYGRVLNGEKEIFSVAQVKQLAVLLRLTPEEAGEIFFG